VLKNGVDRYNIIFLIFTQSLLNPPFCVIFVYNPSMFCSISRFDLCHVLSSSTNNFAHAQTLYRMSSLCRSYECINTVRVNIECFTGCKRIKQRRISFVLGYLPMILWKISTAISIKHGILATFNVTVRWLYMEGDSYR
jgi:hypothetical protein